jgi:hypothetical protein
MPYLSQSTVKFSPVILKNTATDIKSDSEKCRFLKRKIYDHLKKIRNTDIKTEGGLRRNLDLQKKLTDMIQETDLNILDGKILLFKYENGVDFSSDDIVSKPMSVFNVDKKKPAIISSVDTNFSKDASDKEARLLYLEGMMNLPKIEINY